jgi:hypothetical protein
MLHAHFISVRIHTTEFVDIEHFAPPAGTLLFEKHRPGEVILIAAQTRKNTGAPSTITILENIRSNVRFTVCSLKLEKGLVLT